MGRWRVARTRSCGMWNCRIASAKNSPENPYSSQMFVNFDSKFAILVQFKIVRKRILYLLNCILPGLF